MITANVFHRVLLVTFGDSLGTGFTIEVEGRQYLVTARHVAAGPESNGPLRIVEDGVLVPVPNLGLRVPDDPGIDVAVVALASQLTHALPFPATMAGLTWGQDVYFLGYPFGLQSSILDDRGRSLAFVKHAQHSGEYTDESGNKLVVLDGMNVPGMSGGPVVFRESGSAAFKALGVVQSYLKHSAPVLDEAGSKTPMTVVSNPGIVFAYDIAHAVRLASTMANGASVTTDWEPGKRLDSS